MAGKKRVTTRDVVIKEKPPKNVPVRCNCGVEMMCLDPKWMDHLAICKEVAPWLSNWARLQKGKA